MRSWVGISLAVTAGSALLTGCTVPSGGVFGMLYDGTAVVQMCEGHIDGATLFRDTADGQDTHSLGRWTVEPAVTGFSQFSLDKGGNGWRLEGTLEDRNPVGEYTIYGWSTDDSWMASHLTFTDRELARLKPGELVSLPTDIPEEEDVDVPNRVWTLSEFKAKACEVYG